MTLNARSSVAWQVWRAIEEDVVARRALEKGIISLKNLAAYLIRKEGLAASADAVISAIRRYREEKPLEKTYERARQVVAKSESIKITTNITQLVLEKTSENQERLSRAFTLVAYEKGELLLIMEGEQSLKLLVNEKNAARIKEIFPSVRELNTRIAQVNILLSEEAVRTPGIISLLSTELMMHGINLVELMSCVPEMLFFIKQEDVVRAYQVLHALCTSP